MDEDISPLLSNCDDDHRWNVWSRFERRRWFITLLLGTSALYASRSSIPLIIPAVTKELQWSKTDSGTVLSSFFWGYTLTQVLGGYLSDRVGGHRVLCVSAIGWSLITLWMPQIITKFKDYDISFSIIVFFRILHGALQGVHYPAMSSLSSHHLEEASRGSFFSVISSGHAVGMLITGLFGSCILEWYGWSCVLYFIGFLSIMWTLVLFYNSVIFSKKYYMTAVPGGLSSSNFIKTDKHSQIPWTELFSQKSFWSMIIAHACHTNGAFLLMSWVPTYFHEKFPESKGWIMNTVHVFFVLPATVFSVWLTRKLLKTGYSKTVTRKIIQSICFGGQSIGLLVMGHASSSFWAVASMTLLSFCGAFHNSGIHVNPQDLAPKHAGSVFGMMNTVGAMQGFLGTYLAGHILDITNSWIIVFCFTAAIYVLGCILFVVFGSADAIV